ncbi:MAG: DUF1631 family protein [Gammaproteobacteria bacterium]|nr:DUF1631 family protein [Gammaproteobacteria bacterium]
MNKRQHERHTIEHPATMILQDGIKIDCYIQNFSLGGLYIHPINKDWLETADKAIKHSNIVAIKITTNKDNKGSLVIIQASITHISNSGLGAAFLNQENMLLNYLYRISPSNTHHQYSNKTLPIMGPAEISITEWIHSITRKYLETRYQEFIKACYNTLFNAANKAGDNLTQSNLFDTHNALRNSDDEIKNLFLENIGLGFAEFKHGNHSSENSDESHSYDHEMELVAKEDFDEWASVVSLTSNLDRDISAKLHSLENTLSLLNKTHINNKSNPVSPYSLLWAFKKSLSTLDITISAKSLLFSVFMKHILGDTHILHDDIIHYLNNQGITYHAPENKNQPPQQPSSKRTHKNVADTLSSLISFAGSKGRSSDGQTPPRGIAPKAMVVKSLENISTASPRPIIQRVEEQLAGELVNGHPGVVDQQTRDAIQVSESLLGSLQQDFSISPEIQRLIDNLKVPFVRETISNPNLLNDPNHPGHKFLEAIGKLSPFLPSDIKNKSDKGYLYQALEEINKLTEQGAKLEIREITKHLEHLIDYQKDNFQDNLDLVTQSCEQEELYLSARDSVLEHLYSKLTGRPIPKAVEQLLHLGWVGLLVQTVSTLGEDDDNTGRLYGVIDLLLDIFTSDQGIQQVNSAQREYLVTELTNGFYKYPIHSEGARQYITRLEEFFASSGSKHTQLATEQTELNKPLIEKLLNEQSSASRMATSKTKVEQSWLDLVAKIKQDDWIVEQRQQGHVRMLNLAWKNSTSTRYVFVDGDGKKSLDSENNHLALLFKQQQCSLLDNSNLPIVERTVNRLLKNTFEQIKNDNDMDELTNLLGRKGFRRELSELLNITTDLNDQHLMLELDIDQFSMVNDLCGFKGGDKLLQTVANIISNYLPENALLARIGDDEFGIIVRNCSMDEAYHIAETQRRALENLKYTWDGTAVSTTASVGITPINQSIRSATEILNKASTACQQAIQDGGNCTRIYQPTDSDIKKQEKLTQVSPIIEETLKQNKLTLFAQPITPLFLGEGEEHHYEILLRVKNNDGGWGSPEEFIQVAEQYNQMRSVDRWVINQVFSWLNNHHQEVDGTGFSINLSAHSLDDETFQAFINTHLDQSPFPNERITLEITETSLIQHIDKAKELINEIKNKGVKFSLDDFGTGYASYSYLKDFPVDIVKIDGVFVKDILTDSSSYAMVKSITDVSHHMGKKVVAEYVESEAILIALREIEVDFAQGFEIGHPVPIINLLRKTL